MAVRAIWFEYLKAANAIEPKIYIYGPQNQNLAGKENITRAMCIVIFVNKDQFEVVQERIKGLRFRRACRRLLSKFSFAQETSPPPYAEGASVQQAPRKAAFKRHDSLTLPMYASYRKHVGTQVMEAAIGLEEHRGQVFDGESQTLSHE